jgi:hypothetical protein
MIRPSDILVTSLTTVDTLIDMLVPYASLSALLSSFYILASTHGVYTILTLCSQDQIKSFLTHEWDSRTWVKPPPAPTLSILTSPYYLII